MQRSQIQYVAHHHCCAPHNVLENLVFESITRPEVESNFSPYYSLNSEVLRFFPLQLRMSLFSIKEGRECLHGLATVARKLPVVMAVEETHCLQRGTRGIGIVQLFELLRE